MEVCEELVVPTVPVNSAIHALLTKLASQLLSLSVAEAWLGAGAECMPAMR